MDCSYSKVLPHNYSHPSTIKQINSIEYGTLDESNSGNICFVDDSKKNNRIGLAFVILERGLEAYTELLRVNLAIKWFKENGTSSLECLIYSVSLSDHFYH
ncbi:hypothetical protein CEXT_716951 [Caerostris extrusa]|uniref:Uncharacterized protein n=1 Tax=Caerostris extrusa TaxID=172846 RepID=A0AAV4TQL9_CAEEX|nr:hypothetical protein CEXT_716951 [Caerostris extrusa]